MAMSLPIYWTTVTYSILVGSCVTCKYYDEGQEPTH
jgi:hypothetical protein